VAVSAGLLYLLYRTVDTAELGARLGGMDPAWVVLALALSVGQVALSAWRWAYTARQLGIDLPFRRALAEYYLASFLNQVLPGGVAGDISRAWRHGRSAGRVTAGRGAAVEHGVAWPAVHAVVLERLSGQFAVFAAAGASVALLVARAGPGWDVARAGGGPGASDAGASLIGAPSGATAAGAWVTWAVLLLGSALLLAVAGWLGARLAGAWARSGAPGWVESARTALFGRGRWRVQALTSGAVVLSYIGVYLSGAAAMGVDTPAWVLAPLVAPVLLSMLVPVTVAGWGLREGAAALLWSAVGLTAADGVALSVAYGLLVLGSTLPGALVLLLPNADPGRRGGPNPG
jgi:uncharacterized membrane protein YbhN (UPF0104 family)